MAEIWWSKATRDEMKDAGLFVDGRPKGVLHTTEGTSYAGARKTFVAKSCAPHFTVSFERGRFEAWQHIPLNRAARALVHAPGNPTETNKWRAVQVEMVGYADADECRKNKGLYQGDFPEPYLAGIAELMRWIEANAGVARQGVAFVHYPESSGADNGIRFRAEEWRAFNGWCGHQHVPGNEHGDPGDIDIARLIGAPVPATNGLGPAPAPQPGNGRFPDAVHAAACPGGGTWVVGSDGGVGNYRGAPFLGSVPGLGVTLNAPVVAIVPHGHDGYWLVAADGGVFNFGDAPQMAPYAPLFAEYARGDRQAVGATAPGGDRLLILADDGAQYELGRA